MISPQARGLAYTGRFKNDASSGGKQWQASGRAAAPRAAAPRAVAPRGVRLPLHVPPFPLSVLSSPCCPLPRPVLTLLLSLYLSLYLPPHLVSFSIALSLYLSLPLFVSLSRLFSCVFHGAFSAKLDALDFYDALEAWALEQV